MSTLLFAVGGALLVAGAIMVMRGWDGRHQIQRELADQEIVFPAAGDLPAGLAGTPVNGSSAAGRRGRTPT